MMGAPDLFKDCLGDLPEGDITHNALAAKALIRAGLAVVIIKPGDKRPACTLAAAAAKKADLEAQEAARAAGNANWDRVRHDCGRAHVLTEERQLTHKRVKDLLANGANLGVMAGSLGRTRVLVVDLDTREQARAFLRAWSAAVGEEITEPMTVASPGVMRLEAGGEEIWDHKDGGHYWFTVPDHVDFPRYPGKYVGEGDWVAYYADAYALVPPSVRPEGPYRLTGSVTEAPAWLLERIQADITERQERRAERAARMAAEGPKDIDEWAALTPWDLLLEAAGWTLTGAPDSCGCPTWTRPGSPAHLKSATAHEAGCPVYDTSLGHGPIHVWSDAVEINGSKTASKLTFLAWSQHGGDLKAAMRSIGIEPQGGLDLPAVDILDPFKMLPTERPGPADPFSNPATPAEEGEDVSSGQTDTSSPEAPAADDDQETETISSWAPVELDAILDGTQERKRAELFPRMDLKEDGTPQCLLYRGLIHSFHGESESGKSLVLMWEAVRLINEGHSVLWITFDSDPQEDVARALRMGARKDAIRQHLTYVKPDEPPSIAPAAYRALFYAQDGSAREYALAVIDGVTDAVLLFSGGSKGDPNEIFVQFSRIFPRRLADITGAAVVLIDHVAKDTEARGRFAIGAQAKMSQLTGAAYTVEPDQTAPTVNGIGYVILRVGKDRPGDVRRASGPRRGRDRTQEAARIRVDDTGARTVVTVEPPVCDPFAAGTVGGVDVPVEVMTSISGLLKDNPEGLSGRAVEGLIRERGQKVGAARLRAALELLEARGFTRVEKRGKAEIHILLQEFVPDTDSDESTGEEGSTAA
jgi:Bifunctional DNA primase/polymerase, N-terminal